MPRRITPPSAAKPHGHAGKIVQRLTVDQRPARGMARDAQTHAARVLSAKAIAHSARPHPSKRTKPWLSLQSRRPPSRPVAILGATLINIEATRRGRSSPDHSHTDGGAPTASGFRLTQVVACGKPSAQRGLRTQYLRNRPWRVGSTALATNPCPHRTSSLAGGRACATLAVLSSGAPRFTATAATILIRYDCPMPGDINFARSTPSNGRRSISRAVGREASFKTSLLQRQRLDGQDQAPVV